eukprot:GHVU01128624.1.p1 GENE.GHVU01128624.1~~GHVU01128624.1.p1  ORF type:complete len:135 (+),score=20.74 GHVU01128624.1:262-666(+)
MPPRVIIDGFTEACRIATDRIKQIEVNLSDKTPEERRSLLTKCAATSLSSKLIAEQKDYFAKAHAPHESDKSRVDGCVRACAEEVRLHGATCSVIVRGDSSPVAGKCRHWEPRLCALVSQSVSRVWVWSHWLHF